MLLGGNQLGAVNESIIIPNKWLSLLTGDEHHASSHTRVEKPTHIKVEEPSWLLRRSHCPVINLAHVGEPFVARMAPFAANLQGIYGMAPGGAIMAAHTHT